jgi:hypothetical protein
MFSYKGYFITASSNKLEESKKWMTGLCSAESYDSKIPGKEFPSVNQWNSEQEAIDNGIILGKQIVDGKHPEMKLP